MMLWIIAGLVWLVGGYFFSRWFLGSFLVDGRWADGGKANPLLIHLISPVMASTMLLILGVGAIIGAMEWIAGRTDGRYSLRRFYGVDK